MDKVDGWVGAAAAAAALFCRSHQISSIKKKLKQTAVSFKVGRSVLFPFTEH